MEVENLSIGLAFMAGLVSFISPCVLPLVPAYVGYMGGRATTEADKASRQKFATFIHGVFFVLGFTFFFVGFGLLTSAFSSFLNSIGIDIPTVLTRLGGVAVIFFGLYVMKALDPLFRYLLRVTTQWKEPTAILFSVIVSGILLLYFFWAFGAEFPQSAMWAAILFLVILALFRKSLNEATSVGDFWNKAILALQISLISDTRRQMNAKKQGYTGSLGMGIVFAAGWTPCIGPVYGAVLALAADAAADSGSLLRAGTLLTSYSLGLGIPFLLTALAFNQSTTLMGKLKTRMKTIERFSGALLLVIGVLILSGSLTDLSARLGSDGALGEFSYRLEECTAGVFDSRIRASSYPNCVAQGMEKLSDRYIASVRTLAVASRPNYVFPSPAASVEVGLEVGNRAPNFTLQLLSGKEVSLADLRGQAVLVNFWATWCGPCRAEMPEFEQIYQRERERGFTVLAVDLEESAEQVQQFVDDLGLTFPVALDFEAQVNKTYRINQYPTSFLLDGNGVIVLINYGPLSAQTLLNALQQFEPDTTAAVLE